MTFYKNFIFSLFFFRPFETPTHTADHQLLPIYDPSEAPIDDSYTAFEQKKFKYNYLDPNFVPS